MVNPSASVARTKFIIAADDNPNNLRLLRVILESQGYAFIGAASGRECLELVQERSPDLVILDVEMPGLDGFETCRRLRASEKGSAVPVAFYTAHHLDSDLRLGIAAGGNDFLLKPIEPGKLISRVRRLTATPNDRSTPRKPVANRREHRSGSDRRGQASPGQRT